MALSEEDNAGRDAVTAALVAQAMSDFSPGRTQMALSEYSDPNNALSDQTFGPIGTPAAPQGNTLVAPTSPDIQDMKSQADKDVQDFMSDQDYSPTAPSFDPGFQSFNPGSFQSSFASLHDPGDPLGGGVPGYSLAEPVGQPSDVPGPPDAFGGDKGIPGEAGKDFGASMNAPSTPSGWSDFAAMTPGAPDTATAAFAAGFDVGAASVGGQGQGEGAGQGDTSGGGSSSSSSSGDPGGSPGGVG